jgi:hypothetical protein
MISGLVFFPLIRPIFQLRRAFVSRSLDLVRVLVFNLWVFYINLEQYANSDFSLPLQGVGLLWRGSEGVALG